MEKYFQKYKKTISIGKIFPNIVLKI